MERQYPGFGTLCWDCANTNKFKCSWFNPDNQQPVKGWEAKETFIKTPKWNGKGFWTTDVVSYQVYSCPNFKPVENNLYFGDTSKAVRNLDTGEEYRSAEEAALAHGGHGSNVSRACKISGRTAYGHRWEYI